MRITLKGIALLLLVGASACLIDPEVTTVTVQGLITLDAAPVQGAQVTLKQPGVNGLEERRDAMVTGADGRYSFMTEIRPERCFLVVVEVEITGPTGAQEHFGRNNAQTCGLNTMNFEFPD